MLHKSVRRYLIIQFIIYLILISGLMACATNEAAPELSQPDEIRIGVIAPRTGQIVSIGQATVEGAELAVKAINEAGGLEINGQKRKVVLFIEDNKDTPEGAVAAVTKLVNQENVVAIVGPQASRNAIPAAEVAEVAKIPMISPASTNSKTTLNKDYVFRVAFIDAFQGQVMANFVLKDLKITKAAVLYDIASAYNKGIAEIFKDVYEQNGGEIVAFEDYTTDQLNFSEQLLRIKQSQAEVLFLPNYHNEVPAQIQQARKIGLDIVFIGSDSWSQLDADGREEVNNGFFSTHYTTDIANEQAQTFIELYRKDYNQDPSDIVALTYDAFGLLFQAIQTQNEASPQAIRDGLANIDSFTGVTGTMDFKGSGDPIKSIVIVQIKDGEFAFYNITEP